MAKGDSVPDSDYLVRHLKNSQLDSGVPTGAAFERELGHEELSFTSRDMASQGATELKAQLRAVRAAIEATPRKVKPNTWFASVPAGSVRAITEIAATAMKLRAIHDPDGGNAHHCSVLGMPEPQTPLSTAVGHAIAKLVVPPVVQSKSLDEA
jgi:hypothetical protein